ncbi:hypothetical protein CK203_085317 [Vitis vinifera]|uniref:Retrovirus-related Pol polyprotein from transposon RE1 n=1 Tax=Vitis vinifera TaxID=29760 RepID=A0A438DD87_VITVI|nr:hypothetical protein CK203_085317 [Vitis vinifera]
METHISLLEEDLVVYSEVQGMTELKIEMIRRVKKKNRAEHEIAFLRQYDQPWNVYGELNFKKHWQNYVKTWFNLLNLKIVSKLTTKLHQKTPHLHQITVPVIVHTHHSDFLLAKSMANSIQSSNPQQFHGPEVISSQQPNTIQSLHMLNHHLPVKLDRNNYVLWKTQIENVIYANGFDEHIEGLKPCPHQMIATGEVNPDFLTWRRFDRMILSWIFSSLTLEIMGQIIGYQTSNTAWVALEKIFSTSSKARIMQLRLAFQTTRKGSLPIMEYILKMKTITYSLAAIGELGVNVIKSCNFLLVSKLIIILL